MAKKSGGKTAAVNADAISPVPKSKGGRPSTFKPEYTKAIIDYFSKGPYVEVTKEVITQAGPFDMKVNEAVDFPTISGFAISIGVNRSTVQRWCEQNEDFKEAYEMAKDYQERYLLVNGLKGLLPAAVMIFTSKNVLGFRDKRELEHSGKDGGPIQKETTNRIVVEKQSIEERVKQIEDGK